MKLLGNLLWILFGGIWTALGFLVIGLLWCITIIGIPVGVQCFKFAKLALFPFGKEITYGSGFGSALVNILWLIFGGIELAVGYAVAGVCFCVTIIGIPFGLQYFKFARLALLPFGAKMD